MRAAGSHVKRSPHRRALRRWPRRLLITSNLLVAVVLIASAFGYGYVRYRFDSIKTGSPVGLDPSDGAVGGRSGTAPTAGGLSPENILLIGNETRAGQTKVNFGNAAQLTGTLSDIIMILHLDPMKKTASIISIPRDVFAPMPSGSPVGAYQKIDAALNDGKMGPNNLATAITQDFGIPINHYVEVDFDGFLQTVDSLGGIKVDFPQRLFDAYSGLDISHTGCQLIHGQQALAMVRSRHLQYDPPGVSPDDHAAWPYDQESDLSRIVRDHTFIRILASTAKSEGLTNPLKANAFLASVLNQLTIDPGLKNQLIKLIVHYRNVNPFSSAETTIPVTQVAGAGNAGYVYNGVNAGQVEFADQPADINAIDKWDAGAIPAPVKPGAVRISNIAGTNQLAATTGSALRADGFHVAAETTGTVPGSESETLVQYHPGQLAEGISVFKKLRGAVILQSVASVPAGMVDVEAGSTLAVQPPTPKHVGARRSAGSAGRAARAAPTPGSQKASSSKDQTTPYDPRPC